MQMTNWFTIVGWVTILGLLMASCAPAAAPAPAPTAILSTPTATSPTTAPAAPVTSPPSKPATPPPALSPSPKPAQQPKYGGILSIAQGGDPVSFDIHLEVSMAALGPFGTAYSGLVQNDPQGAGKIAPDIAENWEISADGKVYTFRLRKEVKFHDGKPFTAADARVSLERILEKNPRVSELLKQVVVKVEDPDDNTVRMTLRYPYAPIFNYLTLHYVAMMPKHILAAKGDMKRDVVGTGAFKFSRYSPGAFIELVKNQDYFLRGRPYLDGLRFYPIKDPFTRLAALRTNRVNMVYPPSFSVEDAKVVQKEIPGAKAEQFAAGTWMVFYMNTQQKPWDDARVRKAVHLVVDRQKAIEVLEPGSQLFGIIPPAMGGIPESELLKLPGYRQPKDQDRAEAKRLLAEAGYPDGFKTSMLTRLGRIYENFALFMQDQLKTIGVSAEIDIKEDAGFFDAQLKGAYHSSPYRNSVDIQDADALLTPYYKTGSPRNGSRFADKEVDDLITRQSQTADPEQRKQLIGQIDKKFLDLAPAAVTHWSGFWMAWSANVKGFVRPPAVWQDLRHIETWLSE